MKKTLIAFAALAILQGAASAEKLGIERCYELARANYPMIKQFELIRETEKFSLENANTGYLPQIKISANGVLLSDTPQLGAGIPSVPYEAMIQVSQVIWDGGNISAVKEVTKAQARAEIENNEVVLYQLNERVNQLFFGILLLDDQHRQNLTYQSDIRAVISQVSSMIENGVANSYDLDQINVELLGAKQTQAEIVATRKAYARMLSALIGVDIEEYTALERPKTPEAMAQEILRPELAYYDAREKFHDAKIDTVDASLMPTVSLFGLGAYGRPNLKSLSDADFFGLGGISISWEFGDYYTQKNEKLKISSAKRSVRAEQETFVFNTRIKMIQEDGEIKKMAELVASDGEIVALRGSIKEAALARMKNGVISMTDFIRELNAEEMARQRLIYHQTQKLSKEYNYKFLSNN